MSKAILEFNLPEDQEDFDRAAKASDLCSFIHEFDEYLRRQYKYGGTDDIATIRQKWIDLKLEDGIDLDKIYS